MEENIRLLLVMGSTLGDLLVLGVVVDAAPVLSATVVPLPVRRVVKSRSSRWIQGHHSRIDNIMDISARHIIEDPRLATCSSEWDPCGRTAPSGAPCRSPGTSHRQETETAVTKVQL